MDFALSEEQIMFRDSVAAFARKELADGALSRAHSAEFPHEVARKMAAAGLRGILLPEEDGGAGGTLMDAVLAIEQIAVYCPRSADVVHCHQQHQMTCSNWIDGKRCAHDTTTSRNMPASM